MTGYGKIVHGSRHSRPIPSAMVGFALVTSSAMAMPVVLDPALTIRKVMDTGAGSLRLAWNPADAHLYYLKENGEIYRVDLAPPEEASTSILVYNSSDHLAAPAAGLVIDHAGNFYLSSNRNRANHSISTVTKGILHLGSAVRTWSVLAETEPYESASRLFNHRMNALALSPDGRSVFVNIGARTDHGEIQADGTLFTGVRETGLTSVIIELPANGSDLPIPNSRDGLRQLGYLFCEGVRNTFDLAFTWNGHLFGVENGPDRDMPEELNWLRKGHHYGFPWRMGTEDNPQQFAFYDPAMDALLNPAYYAVILGTYQNDPTFPPPPALTLFTDPVPNAGPDADQFRNPENGLITDAGKSGLSLGTFTAHRCPLGLSFDIKGQLGGGYQGGGFVVSWTPGLALSQPGAGPFNDPGQDLIYLHLRRPALDYQVSSTRIAAGFADPVDTQIANRRVYLLENGGTQGIWEIGFPADPPPLISQSRWLPEGSIELTLVGAPTLPYLLEESSDLKEWLPVRTYNGSESPLTVIVPAAGLNRRFFRSRFAN